MNQKFNIRRAEVEDFTDIHRLISEFADFQKSSDRLITSAAGMEEAQNLFHCIVAVSSEEEIIGYATYFPAYYTWTGKAIYLDDLYVKESWRGHGVGSALIHKVIEYARLSGCTKVKWQVSHWNDPAKAFYKSLGAVLDFTEMNCDLSIQEVK